MKKDPRNLLPIDGVGLVLHKYDPDTYETAQATPPTHEDLLACPYPGAHDPDTLTRLTALLRYCFHLSRDRRYDRLRELPYKLVHALEGPHAHIVKDVFDTRHPGFILELHVNKLRAQLKPLLDDLDYPINPLVYSLLVDTEEDPWT